MKKQFLYFLLVIFYLACTSNPPSPPPAEGASILTDSTAVKVVRYTNLDRWASYYSQLSSSFSLNNFSTNSATTLNDSLPCGKMDPEFLQLYQAFLFWSPDSSKVLDLYSYRYIFEPGKNGGVRLLENADSEGCLFSPPNDTGRRLLFSGPAGSLETAFWENNNRLTVLGKAIDEKSNWVPTIWEFDLEKQQLNIRSFTSTIPEATGSFVLDSVFAGIVLEK